MKTDLEELRRRSLEATLASARTRRLRRTAGIAAAWMLPALIAGWLTYRPSPPPPSVAVTLTKEPLIVRTSGTRLTTIHTGTGRLAVFTTSKTPLPRIDTAQLGSLFPDKGFIIVAQKDGPSRIEFY